MLGALAAVPGLAACTTDDDWPPPPTVFLHGVASGDPTADAVILWTRVTAPAGDVEVVWTIASDAGMKAVVDSGAVTTNADRDYTVKIDATGLAAGTTYYYRFAALDEQSPVGRTRTAPTGKVDKLRVGIVSCANFAYGYFAAYRYLAQQDVDVVLHLGDYIYEYADGVYGIARECDPLHEVITLDDYRNRYAQYRSDADLQLLHRQHPMVAIWDDHEVADNSWSGGAVNHDPGEGAYADRRAAALQAYLEWLPIRGGEDGKLYRTMAYGDLADIVVIDTRIVGRDEQAEDSADPALDDPSRSILGAEQEAWLDEELKSSKATYKLIAQQVMMGQLPQFTNTDAWDGYPHARKRLLDTIVDNNIDNVMVLTGDIHSSWAQDVTYDPFDDAYNPETGEGAVAVEVVCPGVSSPGFPEGLAGLAEGLVKDNPHLVYAELTSRGYVVLDIDEERAEARWFLVDTVETPSAKEHAGGVIHMTAGKPGIVLVSEG